MKSTYWRVKLEKSSLLFQPGITRAVVVMVVKRS